MPLTLLGGLAVTTPTGTPPPRDPADLQDRPGAGGPGACRRQGVSREALTEWIWPDRAEGQARSSLHQALTALLRHNPQTTIQKLLRGMPPSLIARQPRYIEGLRKAGLPER